jgi:hypothetical protein
VKFQFISPSGWVGSTFEAGSDAEAVKIAKAAPYFEKVLDVIDWQDEDGNAVVGLVVKD